MDYTQGIKQRLQKLPLEGPPLPWKHKGTQPIGGLREVGFAEGTDLHMVVSESGRCIFDALTGQRVGRDPQALDSTWYDEIKLIAKGFGPLAGQSIRIAGLMGGGLPLSTVDRWHLQALTLEWQETSVILEPPGTSVLVERMSSGCVRLELTGAGEFRICGFSATGRSFVIATTADVEFFAR
jgi:hypothetical protein